MKTTVCAIVSAACVGAAGLAVTPAWGAGFTDPLQTPAQISPLASKSLLLSVAQAGNRLVAVGQRGHIVVSPLDGSSWKQSPVPVSSDLTSVFFVDARQGWAVGHDGVILHSADGGDTWELQLDGYRANELLVTALERKLAADPKSAEGARLLVEAQRYKEQGADKPFLDVWFGDAHTGYAVGAYNLIFRTDDGGKTWQPWFDRTENPKLFNLYAIRPGPDALYIAGEGGLVLKLDPAGTRFKALSVPYNGSLFGVVNAGTAALVFGLRGNALRSEDGGRTWTKVNAGLPATIVGGIVDREGRVVLADVGGRLAASADAGQTFTPLRQKNPVPVAGIARIEAGRLALVGPRGAVIFDSGLR